MATETIETFVVDREGMTTSFLIWRRFRRRMPGLLARIYDVNPGLAAYGLHLPVGLSVKIPVPNETAGTPEVKPIRLWG